MKGPTYLGEDVALFIDWENFKISLAVGHRTPNVSALKEEAANLGRLVVARAYADWVTRTPELRGASQFINDPPALYAAGIEPVYVPTRLTYQGASAQSGRTIRVKNSVDVKMTADCIECAHSYPNIGTYVLVSGDSDFIHVVNTLRTMGKRVVIIGVSWATSRRLADQVDGLVLYDADVDPVTPPEPAPVNNGQATSRDAVSSRLELSEVIRAIEEIVRDERQAGGTPLLTSIKQRLMRRFPGYDEKKVGYSSFKKLMARAAQQGNIKLITAGLVDWAIMADEPSPSEASLAPAGVGGRPPIGSRRRPLKPAEPPAALEQPVTAGSQGAALPRPVDQAAPQFSPDLAVQAPEGSGPATVPSPNLGAILAEALAGLDLPEDPGDGLTAQRAADLLVMADTLEHREGISHVAFNFLVSEVCQALDQGLAAKHDEITQRWSQVFSRAYVSKMYRGLSDGNLFNRGWHSWRDEAAGQTRRRRTFNLDRGNPVIQQVLNARWVPQEHATDGASAPEAPVQNQTIPSDYWEDPAGPMATAEGDQPPTEDLASPMSEAEDDQQPTEEAVRAGVPFLSRLFRPRP